MILVITWSAVVADLDFSEVVKGVLKIVRLLEWGAVIYEVMRDTSKLPFGLVIEQRTAVYQILDRLASRDFIYGWIWTTLTIVLALVSYNTSPPDFSSTEHRFIVNAVSSSLNTSKICFLIVLSYNCPVPARQTPGSRVYDKFTTCRPAWWFCTCHAEGVAGRV